MSVFKRTVSPTGIVLTDTNCVYVCSITGSDINDGTRKHPVATLTRANSIQKSLICINDGLYNENFYGGNNKVFFADKNYYICNGTIGLIANGSPFYFNLICLENFTNVGGNGSYGASLFNCIIKGNFIGNAQGAAGHITKNTVIIGNYTSQSFNQPNNHTQNIITRFKNNIAGAPNNTTKNGIILNEIDLFRYYNQGVNAYPVFYNYLIRKKVLWTWNSVQIPVTYSNNEDNWMNDILSSLINYANTSLSGVDKDYLIACANNSFVNCKVHDDTVNPIFNYYDESGDPSDYSLFLDRSNKALYMSDTGTSVGAFSPNIANGAFSSPVEVDQNGNDIEASGDLMIYNPADGSFESNELSTQHWNRVRTGILSTMLRNFGFKGVQGVLESGIVTKHYYGKKQLFDDENIPVETIEVLPYDDENTVSLFPRFSCSLADDTLMWYHNSGDKSGQPVLYSDLAALGITTILDLSIYGNWAVTSADIDNNALIGIASVSLRNIPIKYFRLEINLHYADS